MGITHPLLSSTDFHREIKQVTDSLTLQQKYITWYGILTLKGHSCQTLKGHSCQTLRKDVYIYY